VDVKSQVVDLGRPRARPEGEVIPGWMSPRAPDPTRWTRRSVLAAAGALALAPRPGRAFGRHSLVDVAELQLPSGTGSRPAAWHRLLFEVMQSTSIEADPEAVQIEPEDPQLFAHPFCALIGTGALPPLSDRAVEQIVRYLSYGGFLLVDDATATPDGPFVRSVSELCSRLFPTRPLSPLPSNHSIYRSFFLIDRPYGRSDQSAVLEGVTVGPVTPLVFCPDDLTGALDRSPDGRDRYPVTPGGEAQRREALKLGINLVMYSLTSNYKQDQAHVLELIREGRLE